MLVHEDGSRAASVEITFFDPEGVLLDETVTSDALGRVDVPEAYVPLLRTSEVEPFRSDVAVTRVLVGSGTEDGRVKLLVR